MALRMRFAEVVGAALLAIAGVVVLPASPANAQYVGSFIVLQNPFDVFPDEPGGCKRGYFCAWRLTSGGGYGVGFYNDKWDWGASDVPSLPGGGSINNNSESWWNNGYAGSYDDVQMYNYAGGSGSSHCVRNGVQIWSGNPSGLRNAVSAHVWRNSC